MPFEYLSLHTKVTADPSLGQKSFCLQWETAQKLMTGHSAEKWWQRAGEIAQWLRVLTAQAGRGGAHL